VDIHVDLCEDVQWNAAAFDHLVVEDKTKKLLKALVTNKLRSEQGTDIIEGKGNGLIVLLHGGPGTGKTFTAESVAEMAQKPLFRVTCGDIGTHPEAVEKYLDSVLYLGKLWDCIVLLDEADVFLEERQITDLERNALVAVFLRILEYYEGILILTSNRVGTFDEAFKSRIQLALHYKPLQQYQRAKIWRNFFNHLKKLEKDEISPAKPGDGHENADYRNTGEIDFVEIDGAIPELATKQLNGRQIRNIITLARQLAHEEGVGMRYSHLQEVIDITSSFDKDLKMLRDQEMQNQ
jgi:SpoVK/Ycf46/Vps4 family AAA+-type ATPase